MSDILPKVSAPPPAIGNDAFTVAMELRRAPLEPHEREFVECINPRRLRRKAALYLDWLAERYGTTRLASAMIPIR